jgi:general secretion pathway protein E
MDIDQSRLLALETDGVLTPGETAHAVELLRQTHEPLDHVLTQLGLVTEADLAERFASETGCAVLEPDLPADALPESVFVGLNPEFLRRERVLPVARIEGRLVAAVVDPARADGLNGLRFALEEAVDPAIVTASRFGQLFNERFELQADDESDLGLDVAADSDRLRDLASAEPVIRLVNSIIARAVEARASDIHLEPGAREAAVRLRVDGVLRTVERLPQAQSLAFVSRIKVLADLDIAERRRPQDGRVTLPVGGRSVDFRVSVVPAQHGESLVVRLLDPEASLRDLDSLGFSAPVADVARRALKKPHGLILVTGPTGSGKTTSLYAFLRQLADGQRKILTIEDPIEYRLPGIAQSQTNSAIGVTFASALRSFLRHDPDVVMVGEIRDTETAKTAVQAAMTGHLVLSTLHTNDAPSAIVRLLDMGVEDYLLGSTLSAVFAQRLVRRLCPTCAGAGCDTCDDTGFHGRMAIAEGFNVDDDLREMIGQAAAAPVLRHALAEKGFRTMRDDGLERVAAGLTREDEVQRAVESG